MYIFLRRGRVAVKINLEMFAEYRGHVATDETIDRDKKEVFQADISSEVFVAGDLSRCVSDAKAVNRDCLAGVKRIKGSARTTVVGVDLESAVCSQCRRAY